MKKGFTIIELMITVTIIGILSTISIVAFNEVRRNSRDSKRISDIERIQTALEFYFMDNSDYPNIHIENGDMIYNHKLGFNNYKALCGSGFKNSCDTQEKVYMGIIPMPVNPPEYSGFYYQKTNNIEPAYKIFFHLEVGFEDLEPGFHTATPNGVRKIEAEEELLLNDLL